MRVLALLAVLTTATGCALVALEDDGRIVRADAGSDAARDTHDDCPDYGPSWTPPETSVLCPGMSEDAGVKCCAELVDAGVTYTVRAGECEPHEVWVR